VRILIEAPGSLDRPSPAPCCAPDFVVSRRMSGDDVASRRFVRQGASGG
jgi:hypothetical protein